MDLTEIYREIDGMEEKLIRTRRDLHRFVESGWQEFRTTALIAERLRGLGIPTLIGRDALDPAKAMGRPSAEEVEREKKRAAEQGADPALIEEMRDYTGAAAVIETGRKGPVIALRFDIDCNDLKESHDPSHRPVQEGFGSVNAGRMHACGHDGHTSIGLAVAEVLKKHEAELSGTVRLLFQPAEEGDRGAKAMAAKGLLDDADVVLAAHIYDSPEGQLGLAGTQTGLYATTKFDIAIHGRSAHAGFAPEEGASAIQAAALALVGMQSFLQDGRGSGRLNIGTIEGGTGRNVVPELCVMRAETRGSDTEVEQRLYHKALATVEGACNAFECTFETEVRGICPAGGGDPDLAVRIAAAAQAVPDFTYTQTELKNTGGTDDFACMMDAVREHGGKACYMGLLTPLKAGHHNSCFDFDERILKAGAKAFLTVIDMLQREGIG